jgi:phosphoglycolate phosphatase-like HAD superfamily hydrolase
VREGSNYSQDDGFQAEKHSTPLPPREGQGGGSSPLTPNEVLVVGDSFYKDILPAQKAGCRTAWFKGEGWTDETYDETIPDMVITDLSDLLVIK